jgi:hypothetical protein
MRSSALTFLFALVAPLSLGSMACFLSTEEGYDIDSYDTGSCEIGTEGCQCTSGGKCNDPFFCNTNLNICVADLCPVGTETCACTPEGACDPGLQCASDLCVDAGCSPGTETCTCTDGGGCDPGLDCLSGLCVDAMPPRADDTGMGGESSGEMADGGSTTTGSEPPPGSTSDASSSGGGSGTTAAT